MQCGGEMALVWFSTQSSDLKIVHRNHLEFLKKILTPRPHCRKNHIRIHGGGNQESGVIDFPGDCHEQPCQRPPTPWRITFTHVIVLCLWNSPGKNTWMGSHSLLQGSSWPRDWTRVSCIAGRFFTVWATREAHWFVKQSVLDSLAPPSVCLICFGFCAHSFFEVLHYLIHGGIL